MTRKRNRRLCALLTAMAALVAATPAVAQDEAYLPTEVEFVDGHGPDVFLLPDVRYGEHEPPESPELQTFNGLGDVVERLLAGELGVRGGAIETDGDRLLAVGPPDAVKYAVDGVGALTRFIEGRCRVGIAVASLKDVPSAPLDAGTLRALLRNGGARLVWSQQLATRRGAPERRDERTSQRFVLFLSDEIAQGASVAAPETAELVTGLRLTLLCRPITSERAVVTLSLQLSQAPKKLRSSAQSAGTLDLPSVPFVSALLPLVLDRGASQVMLLPDPTGGAALAVAVTLSEMPTRPDLPFDLVDLAGLGGFSEVIEAVANPGLQPEDDERASMWETGSSYEEDEELAMRLAGMSVRVEEFMPGLGALVGTDEARSEARRLIHASLVTGTLERTTRRLGWTELTAAQWFDPITGSMDRAALGSVAPEGALRVPLRRGTHTTVFAGTWHRFLASFNVSTAQSAAVATPSVRELFDGDSLIARIRDDGASQVRRRSARLLDLGTRSVAIVRDIEGRRSASADNELDAMRVTNSDFDAVVDPSGVVDSRRVGEHAIVDVFESK